LIFGFISKRVGVLGVESLFNLKGEIPVIMESISFTLYYLDFIINSFQPAGMNGVLAVVDNPVGIFLHSSDEGINRLITDDPGDRAPGIQSLSRPSAPFVFPDFFQFFFQDYHDKDVLVEVEEFSQVRLLIGLQARPVLKEQVFGASEDILVFPGSLFIFIQSHLIDDAAKSGHDMEQVEDNFDMGSLLLHGLDIRVPHIHGDGLKCLYLVFGHAMKKGFEGVAAPAFGLPPYLISI